MDVKTGSAQAEEVVRPALRDFIGCRFPKEELSDSSDLASVGVLSSMFSMELVIFLEKTLGLRIPNQELDRVNFASVDSMVALASRLLNQDAVR